VLKIGSTILTVVVAEFWNRRDKNLRLCDNVLSS
jgi:hypothetical protein